MKRALGSEYTTFQGELCIKLLIRSRTTRDRFAEADVAAQRLESEQHLLKHSTALAT